MNEEKVTQKGQLPIIPPASKPKKGSGSKGTKRKLSIEKSPSKTSNSQPPLKSTSSLTASKPSKKCDPPRKKYKKDEHSYIIKIGKDMKFFVLL